MFVDGVFIRSSTTKRSSSGVPSPPSTKKAKTQQKPKKKKTKSRNSSKPSPSLQVGLVDDEPCSSDDSQQYLDDPFLTHCDSFNESKWRKLLGSPSPLTQSLDARPAAHLQNDGTPSLESLATAPLDSLSLSAFGHGAYLLTNESSAQFAAVFDSQLALPLSISNKEGWSLTPPFSTSLNGSLTSKQDQLQRPSWADDLGDAPIPADWR